MVRGIDTFRNYFAAFTGSYVIIGGTACDIIINEAGFTPRATKDIDLILIIEALTPDFMRRFWTFIREGEYQQQEKSTDGRNYYRFIRPGDKRFPMQLELFSRKPDVVELEGPAHLTPIPTAEDLSSLSAILLNDDYYQFLISHSQERDGVRIANTEALICLKAKAFLEITARIESGSGENKRQVSKHKGDIFRLAVMLTTADRFELPQDIYEDLQAFVTAVAGDLPDKAIFKEMGMVGLQVEQVFAQLKRNFNIS